MFIKDILSQSQCFEQVKIIVFEGKKELFYGWFEYTTSKDVSYTFKIEAEYNQKKNSVTIKYLVSGVNKEFSKCVEETIGLIKTFYQNEFGNHMSFSVYKKHMVKDVILDIFHLNR